MIIDRMTQLATSCLSGVAALPHLGLIRAEGDDAARFLHGQLTQDFSLLGLHEARLAAYCSAKGRVLASFVGFKRSPNEIVLVCSRDVLAATLKRLSMFVLRAKVKLSDASADFQLLGLAGDAVPVDIKPLSLTEFQGGSLVGLHQAMGAARALWLAPLEVPAPAGSALDTALWQWGEVESGVATVQAAVADAFIPQMLNYESVGGVNFKKGCYPGQEVVARSQYRGTLKRRASILNADVALNAGQEIYTPQDAEQPCGTVVQAATTPSGSHVAIAVLQVSAAASELRLGAADGPMLTRQPLPYPLLAEI